MGELWNFSDVLSLENNKYVNGGGDIRTAVYAVENMYNMGVRTIILAPRFDYRDGGYLNNMRIRRTEYLCEILSDAYPGLKLCMGNLIKYYSGVVGALSTELAKTVAGSRYALLDFDSKADYSFVKTAVEECFAANYRPVIYDAFKYHFVARYACIEELVEKGAYIALDASMFGNRVSSTIKKAVRFAMEKGLVHFVTLSGNRVYDKAAAKIEKIFGSETAEKLFYDNFMKLVSNEYIE